jgi:AP endonuclease-1
MLPHGSYLVNLGNPAEEKRQKSYDCFLDDLQRCEAFGIGLYNFHPGSAMKENRATACGYVADAINRAHRATSTITIVLENMAGQGDVLGSRFEDLRQIIELVDDKDRVGCCIDVCHLFAAGNDIRTPELLHQTLSDFFHLVPPHYLKALHVNDSKFDLGAKKDRHENLGLGFLGLASFWNLLHWPGLDGGSTAWEGWKDVIWVLETPSSENAEIWRREIEIVRSP